MQTIGHVDVDILDTGYMPDLVRDARDHTRVASEHLAATQRRHADVEDKVRQLASQDAAPARRLEVRQLRRELDSQQESFDRDSAALWEAETAEAAVRETFRQQRAIEVRRRAQLVVDELYVALWAASSVNEKIVALGRQADAIGLGGVISEALWPELRRDEDSRFSYWYKTMQDKGLL